MDELGLLAQSAEEPKNCEKVVNLVKLTSNTLSEYATTDPEDDDALYPVDEIEQEYVPLSSVKGIEEDVDDLVSPLKVTDQLVQVAIFTSLNVISHLL